MVVFYRRLPKFGYLRPRDLDEALDRLAEETERGSKYRVLAGGTDLVPQLKSRAVAAPEFVIDLKGIAALSGLEDGAEGLRIGSLATVTEVAASAVVAARYPALSLAARNISARQIQNRATIAGNICNAAASADSAPPLLALGADVMCLSRGDERRVAIEDFFTGPGRTVLKPGELVSEIRIPPPGEGARSLYLKLAARGRMDLAWVGVAAAGEAVNGGIENIRIGLGAVAPTPVRARKAEAVAQGGLLNPDVVAEAASAAASEIEPREDSYRASPRYRRLMVEVLTRRALEQIAGQETKA
ncbi:MAG TPA: xanthine dehydrogenase family protein subunit M [Alphaproteobacteria bacterium]|nr:xanthine dehydrogenase family protein subunit M [Alphaproteobacteria bacterium]